MKNTPRIAQNCPYMEADSNGGDSYMLTKFRFFFPLDVQVEYTSQHSLQLDGPCDSVLANGM